MTRATTLALLLLPLSAAPARAQEPPPRTRAEHVSAALRAAKAHEKTGWEARTFTAPAPRRTPVIDLNEVRVKLLAREGKLGLKVGARWLAELGSIDGQAGADHPGLAALRALLTQARDGYKGSGEWGVPVIVDVAPGVPAELAGRVLELVLALWPEKVCADAAARGVQPLLVEATPRLEVEGRLERPAGKEEKPIIILEDDERIGGKSPLGGPKTLDGDGVIDAYGVGGGAAGAYGQRWGKGSLAREGGSSETEQAVAAALRALVQAQEPAGSWPAPEARFQVTNTSAALLAFLGNGHTHRFGAFKRAINRGANWLKRQQKADGSLGFDAQAPDTLVGHLLATHALAEVYAASRDFTYKAYVAKALDFLLSRQREDGGWGDDASQASRTSLALLAIDAAGAGGVRPEAAAQARALGLRWLAARTDGEGRVAEQAEGSAGLTRPGATAHPLTPTAAAALTRALCGQRQDPRVAAGAKLLAATPPAPADDLLHTCLAAHAIFQAGGEPWQRWNRGLVPALTKLQQADGTFAGQGPWAKAGGPVLATALGALTLEVYYRLERAR